MRKLILLLVCILSFSKCYSQNGWQGVATPFATILDFQFVDSQTGYICGYYGKTAKTTNGGESWSMLSVLDTTYHVTALNFINGNTGWIGGWKSNGFPMFPFRNDIYRTTNGGLNWTLIYNSPSSNQQIADIKLLDKDSVVVANTGFDLYESEGSLISSFNGGASFGSGVNEYKFQFYSLQFLNRNTGWVASCWDSDTGPYKTRIYKTTNSGFSWSTVYRDSSQPKRISSIFFTDDNTGYITKEYGNFMKTTNGGIDWIILGEGIGTLFFFDANTGFSSGGTNAIQRTTDGGLSWSPMKNNNILTGVRKIDFINSLTGWVLGSGYPNNSYYMMRTTTGGLTSVTATGNTVPDNFSLSQNYPNPFNPSTIINYQLAINSRVTLKIYDALGNEIETLVNEKQNAGSYSVDFNAASLPSGIYFYKLVTEKFSETKKMILIK